VADRANTGVVQGGAGYVGVCGGDCQGTASCSWVVHDRSLFSFPMGPEIVLVWNVRGLHGGAHRHALQDLVAAERI
jgi:hypothetical protein